MITKLQDFINEYNGPNLAIRDYEPSSQWYGSDMTSTPEPTKSSENDNNNIVRSRKRKKNKKKEKELSRLDRIEKMTDLHTSGDVANFGGFVRKPGKAGSPSPPSW